MRKSLLRKLTSAALVLLLTLGGGAGIFAAETGADGTPAGSGSQEQGAPAAQSEEASEAPEEDPYAALEQEEEARSLAQAQEEEASKQEDIASRKAFKKVGVTKLRIRRTTKKIILTWKCEKSEYSADAYRVYRKAAGEKYRLLATVQKKKYVDKTADQGAYYRYRIQPVHIANSGKEQPGEKSRSVRTRLKYSQAYKDEQLAHGIAAYIRHINHGVGHSNSERFGKLFVENARKYNVDVFILVAMAQLESTFRERVIGAGRYYGLMQVNTSLGRKYCHCSPGQLLKASYNIKTGTAYLKDLLRRSGHNYRTALGHYIGSVSRAGSRISLSGRVRGWIKARGYIL